MEFGGLLEIVGEEPVFETALLLAGNVKPNHVRRQLSRWVRAGRIYQLRRGIYALAPPYQKRRPHPFVVANSMVTASYVSGQSALAFHGLIPEYAPVVISMTTTRPARWTTPLGSFAYRHIRTSLFSGYQRSPLGAREFAFVAKPEKALLDLVYLTPQADSLEYLTELRLQNLQRLEVTELRRQAELFGRPKIDRAVAHIERLVLDQAKEVAGA